MDNSTTRYCHSHPPSRSRAAVGNDGRSFSWNSDPALTVVSSGLESGEAFNFVGFEKTGRVGRNKPHRGPEEESRATSDRRQPGSEFSNKVEEFVGFVESARREKRNQRRQTERTMHLHHHKHPGRGSAPAHSKWSSKKLQHVDVSSENRKVLVWQSIRAHVPVHVEEAILTLLMKSGRRERDMLKDHGKARFKEISKRCRKLGIQLLQAASLRRHYIKLLQPGKGMDELGLGSDKNIRKAAAIFEKCVASYLRRTNISYRTEEQQRRNVHGLTPPTPDFMLRERVVLSTSLEDPERPARYDIYWIEAKMFYGASTIPSDDKSAVGRILSTARKYVSLYGPGAMVFMYGCGSQLAKELLGIGVMALDAHPLDLRPVERHQRSWCANKDGIILP